MMDEKESAFWMFVSLGIFYAIMFAISTVLGWIAVGLSVFGYLMYLDEK